MCTLLGNRTRRSHPPNCSSATALLQREERTSCIYQRIDRYTYPSLFRSLAGFSGASRLGSRVVWVERAGRACWRRYPDRSSPDISIHRSKSTDLKDDEAYANKLLYKGWTHVTASKVDIYSSASPQQGKRLTYCPVSYFRLEDYRL
jgi:hypothetical protein